MGVEGTLGGYLLVTNLTHVSEHVREMDGFTVVPRRNPTEERFPTDGASADMDIGHVGITKCCRSIA